MRLFIFIFLITSAPILGQNDSISIEKLFDEAYSYEASNPEKALKLYRVIFEKSISYESSSFPIYEIIQIVGFSTFEYTISFCKR